MTITTDKARKLTYAINLNDCLPDITANIVHDSEFSQLPSDIFEEAVLGAINDLIDDFADCPDRYLKPRHLSQFELIAHQYLNS